MTGGKFSSEIIQKFIRQIEKDHNYKINYIKFLDQMCAYGNKEHNPFKEVVSRLQHFITNNNLTVSGLLCRLGATETSFVPI